MLRDGHRPRDPTTLLQRQLVARYITGASRACALDDIALQHSEVLTGIDDDADGTHVLATVDHFAGGGSSSSSAGGDGRLARTWASARSGRVGRSSADGVDAGWRHAPAGAAGPAVRAERLCSGACGGPAGHRGGDDGRRPPLDAVPHYPGRHGAAAGAHARAAKRYRRSDEIVARRRQLPQLRQLSKLDGELYKRYSTHGLPGYEAKVAAARREINGDDACAGENVAAIIAQIAQRRDMVVQGHTLAVVPAALEARTDLDQASPAVRSAR